MHAMPSATRACRSVGLRTTSTLYDGIPLDRVSCDHSLPGGFATAGFYLAAEAHGYPADRLAGSAILPPLFAEDTAYSSKLPDRAAHAAGHRLD